MCVMFCWRIQCLLTVLVLLHLTSSCDYDETMCGAVSHGDVMIGVLTACHTKVETLSDRIHPEQFNCSDFDLRSFVRMLAIIHTINTINHSGFLPGIRLGYLFCDTCSDASKAIQSALHMLALNDTRPYQCEFPEQQWIKAIIGARYSEVSISVARFLGLYMIPQISTTSSAEPLDDKNRFPSFLRTIPSDKHQTRALAQLMAHFDWTWVGVVSGDDDYGRAALRSFLKNAENVLVCTAFQEVLPHYLGHNSSDQRIREVADQIQSSKASVVLLILKGELVERLFVEMIRRKIKRTWIASDSWSMARSLASMKGINMVGDIFGFSFITGENPGLRNFLTNFTVAPGDINRFIEEYKDLRFGCPPEVQAYKECLNNHPAIQCPVPDSMGFKSEDACKITNPQNQNDDFLVHAVDSKLAYGERLATWSIAYAVRSLLKCNESVCSGEKNILPWQLLQELKKNHFTLDKMDFSFDSDGNFATGYDLISWVRNGNERKFKVVGKYNQIKGTVDVDATAINWENPNNTIPESKCSESCPPGTAKKISSIYCCYNCTECEEGHYSNFSDLETCLKCPPGTWSLKGATSCQLRNHDYFRWNSAFAIALLIFTGIGFLSLFSILIIFLVGRQSVVFKVAGGEICFVMIFGLFVSFTSVVLFVGQPNIHICRSRQVMYGLGYTLTVSCILVKAFRTFLAFLFDNSKRHRLNKMYKPPVIITCATALQGLICLFWLIFDSPKVDRIDSPQSIDILLQCDEGSNWGFGFMLGYIALLAFICFILALKGRKVPQRFNETGYIIFSMIIYLFVWVCFTPIYVTEIQERSAVQAAAIVVSNFGIICCHFFPKCYMILFKKKKDISRQAYVNRIHIFSLKSTEFDLKDTDTNIGTDTIKTISNTVKNSQLTISSNDSGIAGEDPETTDSSEMTLNRVEEPRDIMHSPQIRNRKMFQRRQSI